MLGTKGNLLEKRVWGFEDTLWWSKRKICVHLWMEIIFKELRIDKKK